MNASKGYYCLIQYCPDLSRYEAANVGVLLFCPERRFIRARTTAGNDRIRKFFGSEERDWLQINAMKLAIEDRLEVEANHFETLEDLQAFIATRANEVQITTPRPMKVFDPERDLDALFNRLVGGRGRRLAQKRLEQLVAKRFSEERVEQLVSQPYSITVPVFKRTLTVPFGFQNGRLNLVQPVRFAGTARATETSACRYAVEGHSLYQHPDERLGQLQLVVVGEFSSEQTEERSIVRDILSENDVRFFQIERLGELVEEIRRSAKPPHP